MNQSPNLRPEPLNDDDGVYVGGAWVALERCQLLLANALGGLLLGVLF